MATAKSKVKASLLEQLKLSGADKPVFISLVDDYMKLWSTKEKLLKDIETRGISFEDNSASGKKMMKQNPSTKEVVAVSSQMLKIADNNIGARDEWLASFDSFPISDVIEELIPLVIECITTDAKVKNQLATAGLNQKAKFSKRKKSFWLPRKRA